MTNAPPVEANKRPVKTRAVKMAIRMIAKAANDLPKADRLGKSDPYCEFTFHEEKQSTKVVNNNQNPKWNESFKWTLEVVPEPTEGIQAMIFDHDIVGKNKLIAKGVVPLAEVLEKGSAKLEVALQSPKDQPLESTLSVEMLYKPPASMVLQQQVDESENAMDNLQVQLNTTRTRLLEVESELRKVSEAATENKMDLSAKKETVVVLAKLIDSEKEHYEAKLRDEKLYLQDQVQELTARLEQERRGQGGSQSATQLQEANDQLHEVERQQKILQKVIPGFKTGEEGDEQSTIETPGIESASVPQFEEVEDRVLTTDDLNRVRAAIIDAATKWHNIGVILGLRPSTLKLIKVANFDDVEFCLNAVLAHWLNQDYLVTKHGQPTWRKLLMAIAHPAGADDTSLANRVAMGRQPKSPGDTKQQPPKGGSYEDEQTPLLHPSDESKKVCCTIL